jgi:hypothetical protein
MTTHRAIAVTNKQKETQPGTLQAEAQNADSTKEEEKTVKTPAKSCHQRPSEMNQTIQTKVNRGGSRPTTRLQHRTRT